MPIPKERSEGDQILEQGGSYYAGGTVPSVAGPGGLVVPSPEGKVEFIEVVPPVDDIDPRAGGLQAG